MANTYLDVSKLEGALRIESAFLVVLLICFAWATYKLFLKKVSEERHRLLMAAFRNLFLHAIPAVLLYVGFVAFQNVVMHEPELSRFYQFYGLISVSYGLLVLIKTCRLIILEYLFLSHMTVPVPILLVNLFTTVLAISLGVWIFAELFGVQLTPFLATSAVLSLVLGLALQDTLGNLIAGIALQLDKSYEIGDWIEIHNGGQKLVGRIQEITWRATALIGFLDEQITIPNRVMSQAQVLNYGERFGPIIRSHIFRVPFGTDIDDVRRLLLKATAETADVCVEPAPLVLVSDTTESWVVLKLVYYVRDFGSQYLIADKLLSRCLNALRVANVDLASQVLRVQTLEKI